MLSTALAVGVQAAQQIWTPVANGNWNTTTPNWDGGVPWIQLNSALFNGTGTAFSNVLVTDGLSADALQFDVDGYTVGGSGSLSTNSVVVTNAGTTATFNLALSSSIIGGAGDLILNGIVSGGFLTKVGTGTVTLAGANTFNAPLTIMGGAVSVSAANNLGDGSAGNSLTLAGGTLRATSSFNLGSNRTLGIGIGNGTIEVAGSDNLTVDGTIFTSSSGVILTKTGTGTLTFTGTNNAVGVATTVNGGTVSFASNTNLGSGRITLNSGTLQATGSTTITNGLNLGLAGGTVNVAPSQTLIVGTQGVIGLGSLTKTGAGTLQLNVASTYAGATTISEGTLSGGIASFLPARTRLAIASGATLNLNGVATTVASLSGAGTVTNTGAAVALTLGNVLGNLDTTFSGVFNATTAASLTLSKVGGGTLTLTNSGTAGTATGAWTLTAGTIKLDYANAGSQVGNIINGSIAPAFGGGTLQVVGRSGATVAQVLGNVSLSAGGGVIRMTPNGGTSTTLTLGTIPVSGTAAATTAGGALLIDAPSGTAVRITTTDVTNGTYGGRVVFYDGNNYNWAANGGGASPRTLTGFTGYTALVASGSAPATNYLQTDTLIGGITATQTVNSLKISTTTTGQSLDLNGNALTLATGGLLFTGAQDFTILTTGGLGTLKSGTLTNSDFIVQQYGTGVLTITAPIVANAGTSTLTKAGSGTLVLGGANTYTGGTFIDGGVLSIGSNSALGATATSTITISDGATLRTTATLDTATHAYSLTGGNATFDVANGTILSVGALITGSGGLTLTNTGTLLLNFAATYTGPTFIGAGATLKGGVTTFINATAGGTLTVASGGTVDLNNFALNVGALAGSGTVTNSGATASTLSLGSTTAGSSTNPDSTFSGTLSGAINLGKNGSGTLTLTNPATYTGTTAVTSGRLLFGVNNALPTGALTIGNNAGVVAASVDLNSFNWTSGAITFYGANALSTSQASLNIGPGSTLTLGGTVTVTLNAAGGFQPAFITGGVLDLGTATRTFSVADSANAATDLTISSAITSAGGAFGLTKTGVGTLLLTGANTYTGTTTLNGGVLALAGNGTLGVGTSSLAITTGTLVLNGSSVSVGILSGGATAAIVNGDSVTGPVTLSIGNGSASSAVGVYAGSIGTGVGFATPNIAVVKNGAGAITLSGVDDYTGGTLVNDGVLAFGSKASQPGTGITKVAANAALGLGVGGAGFFSVADVDNLFANNLANVTLASGAGVGIDTGAGDFDYTSSQSAARGLVKLGANVLTLSGNNSYTGGTTILAGTLAIDSDGRLGAVTGGLTINGGTLRITGTSNAAWNTSRPLTLISSAGFEIADPANNYTIGTNLTGAASVTKVGNGTLTLGGTNSYTGNTIVSAGALNVTGSYTGSASILNFGASAANTVVNVSGDMTLSRLFGASNAGAAAVYNQTAGTVTVGYATDDNTSNGVAQAGYGSINLTGGTLNWNSTRLTVTSGVATGVVYVGGTGVLNAKGTFLLVAYNGAGAIGSLTVGPGGSVIHDGASQPLATVWTSNNLTGIVNVTGGLLSTTTQPLRFGGAGSNTGTTSFANFAGGTFSTGVGIVTSFAGGSGNNGYLNFAGGTIKTTANVATLTPATTANITVTSTLFGPINNTAATGDNSQNFVGGLTVDTNGFNSSVTNALVGAGGMGVRQADLTVAGGSGYIGAPAVIFSTAGVSAGGTPASGYALVSGGQLTGIVITSPGTYDAGTVPTITLSGGGGTGASVTSVALNAANVSGGLTKTGNGTLTLTAANTFSGATVVNGGILSVAPTALPNTSSLIVGGAGAGTLDLYQDNVGAAWAMATNASIILGGASTGGSLGFQLGTASDRIVQSGTGGLTVNAGGGFINAQAIAGFGVGSYDVITGLSSTTGFSNLQLGSLPGGYSYSLSNPTGKVTLTVSAVAAGNFYWTGDTSNSWATIAGGNSNWSTTANGLTDPGYTPGSANVVYFSAANVPAGAINTTLDNAFSIQGLKFLSSGAGTVTVAAGSGGALTVGADGIEVQTGAPTSIAISAPLAIGSAQSWRVADSGSLLALSGVISGGLANSTQAAPGSNVSLTITGAGAVAISNAANTFTGDILVDGGTLNVSNDRSWGGSTVASSTSHTVTLINGGRLAVLTGTINPGSTTTTNYNLVQVGSGGGIVDVSSGATLQLDDGGQLFGSGTLTKNGVGTLTLRSQTAYTGNLVIAAGTLLMTGTSGGFGTTAGTTTISSGATLNLNGQVTTDLESLTINGAGLASLPAGAITNGGTTSAAFAGAVILGSDATVGSAAAGTLTLSGGITGAFNLTVKNGAAGGTTLSTATVNNGGTITNSGAGTGLTTISAVIGANVTGVIQNSTTSAMSLSANNTAFAAGVTIKQGSLTAVTSTGALGTGTLTLGDTAANANSATLIGNVGGTISVPIVLASGSTGTLTITSPNNGTLQVFSGGITGANNLVIAGTNVQGISFTTNLIDITGTLTARGTGAGAVTVSAPLGANISSLIQDGTSTLILSGTNTRFVGGVIISNGTLQLGNVAALSAANTVSISTGANLNLNGNAETIGGLNGTGTATNSGVAKTLTLGGSGTYSFGGAITATTPANMALTVALTGNGSQTLSGISTYTGATTINQGSLILNFDLATTATNILSSSSPLVLGGGTLSVIGDAAASSQTFASTALTAGTVSNISATAGAGGLTLDLGTVTRNANSILNVNLTNNPVVTLAGTPVSNGVAVGSNGAAFLTLNGVDWGTVSGGNLAVATYQNDNFSSPANNVNVTTSGAWNGTTVNTLRFNTGTSTLTLSGANTLSAGGLLVGSGAGAVTIGGMGTLAGAAAGGTVAAPTSGELGIIQNSPSVLTISAPIVNNAGGLSYVTATPTGTLLNKYGTGTVVLASTRNAYTGGTNIANGVLRLGASEVLPDGAAQAGTVTVATPATLDLAGFTETINGLAGTGTVDNTSATAATLYIGSANAATTFSGVIQNTGGAASLALTKIGTGTMVLTGANTYGGATTISMGGLTLNFTLAGAPLDNIISSASALNLGSSTLTVTGSTTANSQTFNNTTLVGGGRVTLSGTTPALTVNLGAISRRTGTGGTINVTLVAPGVVKTTNTNDATGLLGGWAVVNSADFATVSAGNIVAYTGYTTVAAATGAGSATQNALFNTGNSVSAATVDYNTIKIGSAGPIFAATTNILRLGAVGAILLPTGGAATTIGAAANTGVITAGGAVTNGAGELDLINWSSNAITVNSVISNNGTGVVTLVKSGTGGVTLAGTNTYSGGTIVSGGTLTVTATTQLGTGAVTLNGGTLSYSSDSSLTLGLILGTGGGTFTAGGSFTSARSLGAVGDIVTVGTGPRTLTINGGTDVRQATLQSNLIDGTGGATSLVVSMGSDLRILRLSGTNTYTGTTSITRGILDFSVVAGISGGLTSASTVGNIVFGATGTNRAILQNSVAVPVSLTRSLGYGDGQIHWEGNGGFSNDSVNTTWAINLGGAGAQLVWGDGGFVPTGSILQFGVASITNTVTTRGALDFQNGIDLGDSLRVIESASANNKLATSPYDVLLSGNLVSSTGGGLNKTGAGIMVLTGTNNTSATTSVTLTAGGLIFGSAAAIPGSGANITLSTTAGGATLIGVAGDTNPIATLGSRIVNPLTASGAFALGADSSADLDFTAFPNMRLAGYAYILPTKAITYTGTITPANSTYLLGGAPYSGSATNTLATTLVLANYNALTGANAVNLGYGTITLLGTNDYTSGTVVDGLGIGTSIFALGSNSALGTGNLALNGSQTKTFGAVNGDHYLANNVSWAGSGTSWVMGADAANDGVSGTSNGGGLTYLGTITISNTATAPTILSRSSHQVLILGDVNNGALTSGLTYNGTTSAIISSLATAANGGVAKTYNGTSVISSITTVVIDADSSFGASGNISMGGSGSASNTATLRLQAGSGSVTLNASRTFSFTADRNFEMRVGASDTLTIAGVLNAQGTNTGARNIIKTDAGTLILTNKSNYTGASTFSPGLAVRGGVLRLDSSTGNFTAAADRFFPDAANALPVALGVATGTFGGGGTLEIIQANTNAFGLTQGFGGVTFNTGANTVSLVDNSVTQSLTLSLGAFTRTALLGGTVNFVTSSAGGANIIASANVGANGIIGGYATFNGLDWATGSGSAITALLPAGYTVALPASGSTAAGNYLQTGSQTVTTSQGINSLKFAPTGGPQSISLNTGVVQTVTSGGVIFDNAGGSATITGAGQLGVNGTEIIVHTYGSGVITTNKLTLNGVIKGASTVLTKTGPGTLVLAGNNTYTGALIINAGVVEYSNGSATGQNLGSPSAGAANIVLNGGTLRQTATGNLIFGITVNGYSKLDVPSGVTLTQSAQGITGKVDVPGILQKTGTGALTFSGTTDNPTLGLEVVEGTVNLGKTSSATVHSVGVASGSTAAASFGAALIVGNTATAAITGSGGDQIHDQSSVVVRTGGILNLGGGAATAEAFDGLAGGGSVTNTGLTGTFTLTLGAGNDVNISSYSVAAAAVGLAATGLNSFSGVISDGAAGRVVAITKTGGGIQIFSGLNTYSGATSINAGTLQLGVANALPSGVGKGNVNIVGNGYGAATINGGTSIGTADKILAPGTLDMGGFDQAINGLNSSTGGYVLNNPTLGWNGSAWVAAASTNTLTVGNNDAAGSFNGALRDGYTVAPGAVVAQGYVGKLSLTKVGTGVQTLGGANTYTGPTNVNGGTLSVSVSGSLSGTTATVAAPATLNVAGTITTPAALTVSGVLSGGSTDGTKGIISGAGGNVVVNSGGRVSPGATNGLADTAILTANAFSASTGAHLDIQIAGTTAGTQYDKLVVNSATASAIDLSNDSGSGITLALSLAGYTLGMFDKFYIVENRNSLGSVHGTFANATTPFVIGPDTFNTIQVGGVMFAIGYSGDAGTNSFTGGNDVVLMAVPEPNSLAMLAGSLSLALGLQRFRRRRG